MNRNHAPLTGRSVLYISAWIALPWLLNACQPIPMSSRTPIIHPHPLPYQMRLQQRALERITLVVIHCTELPDLDMARRYGEQIHYADSQTGNSGHFYIDRDGRIEQYVPIERVAHHVSGHNANSIGIELVNLGRYPDWHHSGKQQMTEPYTDAQLTALIDLLDALQQQLPALTQIAGHQDLDQRLIPASDDPEQQVARKRDPGEQFPWSRILSETPLVRLQSPPSHR